MAVDEASFNTSMVRMSAVLMFLMSSVMTPSTTYSGSAPPMTDPVPRILTLGAEPGAPELVICTPAIFDCNAWEAVSTGCCMISAPLIDDMAPVRSFFFAVAYPMTTACSMGFSMLSCVDLVSLLADVWAWLKPTVAAVKPSKSRCFFIDESVVVAVVRRCVTL